MTCTPASGSTFAIGTTTVTCTAVDDDGATATGSFTVAVRGAREQLARFLVALTGVAPTSSYAATITTVVNRLPDRSLTLACEPLRLISKVLQRSPVASSRPIGRRRSSPTPPASAPSSPAADRPAPTDRTGARQSCLSSAETDAPGRRTAGWRP